MAKYEDYAKKYLSNPDGLDEQIEQAQEQQTARETETEESTFAMPDRFKNKSAEEIAAQYLELQRLNSRQAQDLGTMRNLVDQLAQSPTPEEPAPEPERPIVYDDLLDNPDDAIRGAIDTHPVQSRVAELERMLLEQRTAEAKTVFAGKHPDYVDISQDPGFQNWVASDNTRIGLYKQADTYDFGAADALLSLYKAEKGVTTLRGEVDRQAKLNDGMLESSGGHEPPVPQTFSRTAWLQKLTRSKQGDPAALEYVHRNSEAYRIALGSGNVRD